MKCIQNVNIQPDWLWCGFPHRIRLPGWILHTQFYILNTLFPYWWKHEITTKLNVQYSLPAQSKIPYNIFSEQFLRSLISNPGHFPFFCFYIAILFQPVKRNLYGIPGQPEWSTNLGDWLQLFTVPVYTKEDTRFVVFVNQFIQLIVFFHPCPPV